MVDMTSHESAVLRPLLVEEEKARNNFDKKGEGRKGETILESIKLDFHFCEILRTLTGVYFLITGFTCIK